MKFIVDNPISPFVSKTLNENGFDSIHVRDLNMQAASDRKIFDFALKEERVIISADTDFSYILSELKEKKPSLILFRKNAERSPVIQSSLLIKNLNEKLIDSLNKGCIVIIEPNRLRIKNLPI